MMEPSSSLFPELPIKFKFSTRFRYFSLSLSPPPPPPHSLTERRSMSMNPLCASATKLSHDAVETRIPCLNSTMHHNYAPASAKLTTHREYTNAAGRERILDAEAFSTVVAHATAPLVIVCERVRLDFHVKLQLDFWERMRRATHPPRSFQVCTTSASTLRCATLL